MTHPATDPEIFVPGLRILIEIPYISHVKFESFLRGHQAGQYLILDHPIHNGTPVPLSEDAICVLSYIHQGQQIGFRSTVLAVVKKPYPLIFISFPDSIDSSRLRASDRFPVRIETIYSQEPLRGLVEGRDRAVTLNISAGGCLVECLQPFDVDERIYLTIFLREPGPVHDLPGQVRRSDAKGEKYWVGISFLDLDSPGYQDVSKFLQRLKTLQVRA